MNADERLRQTEKFLVSLGWDADEARETAAGAAEDGYPLLETLCFQTLAEHLLAPIHDTSWVTARASSTDSDDGDLIRRLLDSGASAEDLAVFARMMQREYLCNLMCLLDEAGVYGVPRVPIEDLRLFAVDDDERPQAMIADLHEALAFESLETEMEQSRRAAKSRDDNTGGRYDCTE